MADGFEEVEAVTPIDYLRRAGVEVSMVSITDDPIVTGRWGEIMLDVDFLLEELLHENRVAGCEAASLAEGYDAVIIPGGMPGATNIAACEKANELIKEMAAAGKIVAAICASPVIVLAPLGLLNAKRFTCYPGMEENITDATWCEDRVVTDGNIITSRAAGTSGEWSIAIIESLVGRETAEKIKVSTLI